MTHLMTLDPRRLQSHASSLACATVVGLPGLIAYLVICGCILESVKVRAATGRRRSPGMRQGMTVNKTRHQLSSMKE